MIKEIVKQLYLSSRIGNKRKMATRKALYQKKQQTCRTIQSDFFTAPTSLWVHLANPNSSSISINEIGNIFPKIIKSAQRNFFREMKLGKNIELSYSITITFTVWILRKFTLMQLSESEFLVFPQYHTVEIPKIHSHAFLAKIS